MKTKKSPKVVTSANTDHTLVKAMRAITNFIGIIEKASHNSPITPTEGPKPTFRLRNVGNALASGSFQAQEEAQETINNQFNALPPQSQRVVQLRIDNPELTLLQLATLLHKDKDEPFLRARRISDASGELVTMPFRTVEALRARIGDILNYLPKQLKSTIPQYVKGQHGGKRINRRVRDEALKIINEHGPYANVSPTALAKKLKRQNLDVSSRTVSTHLSTLGLSNKIRNVERDRRILGLTERGWNPQRIAGLLEIEPYTVVGTINIAQNAEADTPQQETPPPPPPKVVAPPEVETGEKRPLSYPNAREQLGLEALPTKESPIPIRTNRKINATSVENTPENGQKNYQEQQLMHKESPSSIIEERLTEEDIDRKLKEYKQRWAEANVDSRGSKPGSTSPSQGSLPANLRNEMREPRPENTVNIRSDYANVESAYQEKQLMEQQGEEEFPHIKGREVPPPRRAKTGFDRRGATRPKGLTQANVRAGRTKVKRHTHMNPQNKRLTSKELLPSMDSQGNFVSNKSIPFTPDKQEVLSTAFNAIDSFIKQMEPSPEPDIALQIETPEFEIKDAGDQSTKWGRRASKKNRQKRGHKQMVVSGSGSRQQFHDRDTKILEQRRRRERIV